MQVGKTVIDSGAFIGIIVPEKHLYDRYQFLQRFAEEAYYFGITRNKRPYHVNYWYDGPCGNVGLELYKSGDYRRLKRGVVAFSRLNVHESEEMIQIAQKMVETLLRNQNIILLMPTEQEAKQNDCSYLDYYQGLFPEAVILEE